MRLKFLEFLRQDLGKRGGKGKLGEVEGEETVVGMYYTEKNLFSIIKKKKEKMRV